MPLTQSLIAHLQSLIPGDVTIRAATRIYGGHISQSYRLATGNKDYFVKVNSAAHFPGMFEAEAKGLRLLAHRHTVSTPSVVAQGSWAGLTYILMEWIEPGEETPTIHA